MRSVLPATSRTRWSIFEWFARTDRLPTTDARMGPMAAIQAAKYRALSATAWIKCQTSRVCPSRTGVDGDRRQSADLP